MKSKTCHLCGAKWLEGQHYWSTGAKGSEADLAGLVCDQIDKTQHGLCINPQRGRNHNGQTWEKRAEMLGGMQREIDRVLGEFDKKNKDAL